MACSDELVRSLMRPGVLPGAAGAVELIETHISWVLLAGEHAWKLKKPLDLGFLDQPRDVAAEPGLDVAQRQVLGRRDQRSRRQQYEAPIDITSLDLARSGDDIIDIDSDPDESGKVPGTDLREGVHTLPVLYALRESGPEADRLRELLAGPVEHDEDVAEALSLLRASPGMARAREMVVSYAAQAQDELADLPDGPGRQALALLVDYTVHRHG